MPFYEYRCKDCDARYELQRSMADASAPAPCPFGHTNSVKLLSSFAAVGSAAPSTTAAPASRPTGGCGSGCGCAH
jgi:putative FmdB family regulatory protein